MNITDAPKKQPVPFAVNGQRENLLPSTPAGDNTASYSDGFPPVTMILKAAGGLPPKGQDINQILYELSAIGRWFSAGALNTYDASFSTAISGYPKGSVLLSNDSSNIFISTIDANSNNPNTSSTGWLGLLNFLGGSPLSSPAFTGTPTGPTATTNTTSTQLATTAFVHQDSSGVVGEARNLKMSVASASATANLTADEVIVGTALGGSQYRIANVNKTINLATTGAGGMDTGSAPANGWVSIYVIFNPATGASALLGVNTTSIVAPSIYGGSNMPSGYTASALVSIWRTNGSSVFQAGHQRGRKFITPRVDVLYATSNPGPYTAIGLTAAVPQNAILCTGYAFCNTASGTGAATLILSSETTGIGFVQAYAGTTGAIGSNISFEMLISVVQNIFYQFSWTTSGVSNATVGINGYII